MNNLSDIFVNQTFESIPIVVNRIACNLSRNQITKRNFHYAIQDEIYLLASSFHLSAKKEYRVNHSQDGDRGQLIDVVWLKHLQPIIGFEIDSCFRFKSINKLLALDCQQIFWVYYGQDFPRNFVEQVRNSKPINLIWLQNMNFTNPTTIQPKTRNHL